MDTVENSTFGVDMLKNMINMKMMTKLLKEDGKVRVFRFLRL